MHFFATTVTAAVLAASALAAVAPIHAVEKYHGETTGRFIVQLKKGVSKDSVVQQVGAGSNVTHNWQNLNGFAGMYMSDPSFNTRLT